MSVSEDRERIAEERRLAHAAQITMAKALSGEGRSNSEIAQILGISENNVREVLKPSDEINWGYNCLTAGIHHGRPEALWQMPLLQMAYIFNPDEIEELIVTRIYNDAMQFVEHLESDHRITTPEWAARVKEFAKERYLHVLELKIGEITRYYESSSWHRDVVGVIARLKENKLNSGYQPLHSHDSINMLCRIVGVDCARKAS